MTKPPLSLSYAGELYDRTVPLFSGMIQPVGVDLRYIHTDIPDLFWRMGKEAEFDVCEFSTGAYLASVEDPAYPYTAIPVFVSRQFRHASIFYRPDSGIRSPKDLEGRRIGTPEWSATASLWARGILGEHYGVDIRSIKWRTGGLELPGRAEKTGMRELPGYDVKPLDNHQTLVRMYRDGELDGIVSAVAPSLSIGEGGEIRRLFPDTRAEEQAYFKATEIFPIMHLVIVRKSLVEEHPWLPNNLKNAFEKARKYALGRLLYRGSSESSLAWEASYAEEEKALLGDPFAYGVEKNIKTIEAMCRYALDQGFTTRLLGLDDLFPKSTHSTTYTHL